MAKRPINEEHLNYYADLEAIRESGICNMWVGDLPLREMNPELSAEEATEILLTWMANYEELSKRFGWRDQANQLKLKTVHFRQKQVYKIKIS